MTDGDAPDAAQAAGVARRIYAAELQKKTGMNTFVVNVQNRNSTTLPPIVKAGNGDHQDYIQVGTIRENLLMNVEEDGIVQGFENIANLIHMDQTRVLRQIQLIKEQDIEERDRKAADAAAENQAIETRISSLQAQSKLMQKLSQEEEADSQQFLSRLKEATRLQLDDARRILENRISAVTHLEVLLAKAKSDLKGHQTHIDSTADSHKGDMAALHKQLTSEHAAFGTITAKAAQNMDATGMTDYRRLADIIDKANNMKMILDRNFFLEIEVDGTVRSLRNFTSHLADQLEKPLSGTLNMSSTQEVVFSTLVSERGLDDSQKAGNLRAYVEYEAKFRDQLKEFPVWQFLERAEIGAEELCSICLMDADQAEDLQKELSTKIAKTVYMDRGIDSAKVQAKVSRARKLQKVLAEEVSKLEAKLKAISRQKGKQRKKVEEDEDENEGEDEEDLKEDLATKRKDLEESNQELEDITGELDGILVEQVACDVAKSMVALVKKALKDCQTAYRRWKAREEVRLLECVFQSYYNTVHRPIQDLCKVACAAQIDVINMHKTQHGLHQSRAGAAHLVSHSAISAGGYAGPSSRFAITAGDYTGSSTSSAVVIPPKALQNGSAPTG